MNKELEKALNETKMLLTQLKALTIIQTQGIDQAQKYWNNKKKERWNLNDIQ